MTIDLRKDAPNQVSNVNPDELSNEINTLQEIKQEVINQELKLKELKEREKYYSNIIIPDLMNQLNLKTLKLKDGSEISVKDVFGVSIIAAIKAEAHTWLRKNAVHAGTLRTTLRDYHQKGGSIPAELFNTFEGNQTEIKTKN